MKIGDELANLELTFSFFLTNAMAAKENQS